MSDLSFSFGPKSVVVEASYSLLGRAIWKSIVFGVLLASLLMLNSDTPRHCDWVSGTAKRVCELSHPQLPDNALRRAYD